MLTIIGMRLHGYVRGYYAIAPAVAGLVLLGVLYGGGVTRPEEAYGVSALVLFPVLAWQAQIVFNSEPDAQRRLTRLAAGAPSREITSGLVAAAAACVPMVVVAMILPWVFQSVRPSQNVGEAPPLGVGGALAVGLWAHLLVIPAAVALGGLASRAVSRTRAIGVTVLVTGTVLSILFGLSSSPVALAAPPLMAAARAAANGASVASVWWLSVWAAAWAAIAMAIYWRFRLRRP
jgi:hypothetical protein